MDFRVYSYAESASDTFVGNLDDKISMTDNDVIEYIRVSRPDLFDHLFKRPLASSKRFSNLRCIHLTAHTCDDQDILDAGIPVLNQGLNKLRNNLNHQPLSLLKTATSVSNTCTELLEIQHKRYVQTQLLHGAVLVLRRLIDPNLALYCNYPRCLCLESRIPPETFFLLLKNDEDMSGHGGLIYCLDCLEYLFEDTRLSLMHLDGSQYPGSSLDGVADAAELSEKVDRSKGYLKMTQRALPIPACIGSAAHICTSNSDEAVLMREFRTAEIESTLRSLKRYEERSKRMLMDQETPDLQITRIPDVAKPGPRYKKQGLSEYEYQKSNVTVDAESPKSPEEAGDERQMPFYCECQEAVDYEPSKGINIIHCNSATCVVGYFHADCCGANQFSEQEEAFCCRYCTEGIETPSPRQSKDACDAGSSGSSSSPALSPSLPSANSLVNISVVLSEDLAASLELHHTDIGEISEDLDGEEGDGENCLQANCFKAINVPSFPLDNNESTADIAAATGILSECQQETR